MGVYKCKSCGGENQDFFKNCAFCGAPNDNVVEMPVAAETKTGIFNSAKKSKKGKSDIGLVIGGAVLLVFAVIFLIAGLTAKVVEPRRFSEISAEEVKEDGYYYFDRLLIVDGVAEEIHQESSFAGLLKKEDTSGYMLLAAAADKDDKLVLVPFFVPSDDDDLTEEILEYVRDASAEVGDLVITSGVKAKSFSTYADGMEAEYNAVVDLYSDIESDLVLDVCFHHIGDDVEDVIEEQEDNKAMFFIMGGIFGLVGAVLVVVFVFIRKKKKQAIANASVFDPVSQQIPVQ